MNGDHKIFSAICLLRLLTSRWYKVFLPSRGGFSSINVSDSCTEMRVHEHNHKSVAPIVKVCDRNCLLFQDGLYDVVDMHHIRQIDMSDQFLPHD